MNQAYFGNQAYLSLMSELYGPFGLPLVGFYNTGYGYGHHRYFGVGYYGIANRNYYGNSYANRNNSMYFGQMRRLSQLSNDLSRLSNGAGAGGAANAGGGFNGNMTSRIRGDLMGVVFSNGAPPYQTVHQLASDLVTHLPNRSTPMINSGQLAQALMVVMNASGQSGMQVEGAIGSAQSALNMSGVHGQGIQTIVGDMAAVATWGHGFVN
jgi:hypothetical protein